MFKLLKVKITKVDQYDRSLHSDLIDDNQNLTSIKSIMKNLYGYLSVHVAGNNQQPWRDSELTNFRNGLRRVISECHSKEIVSFANDVLTAASKIKNEKSSLQNGMLRLKELAKKFSALGTKYQRLEKEQEDQFVG